MENKSDFIKGSPKIKEIKSLSPKMLEKCRKESDLNKILPSPRSIQKSILKKNTRLDRLQGGHSPSSDNDNNLKGAVTWDTQAIDEQNNYRKLHPGKDNKKMKIEAETKFKSVENCDDFYLKALNDVNNMKITDEIFLKILSILDAPPKRRIFRTKSTKCAENNNKHLEEIYSLTEKEKLFDNVLDTENVRTLQNTMLNKFYKEIESKSNN